MTKTNIEWTDRTWNPVRGCSHVSAGCVNCYAERIAARFSFQMATPTKRDPSYFTPFAITKKGKPLWTGKVELIEKKLLEPLSWRKPQKIFVNSMSDLFHESLPFEEIGAVFGVMAVASWHTFQVLTKRPQRMREFFEWIKSAEEWGDDLWTRVCRLAARRIHEEKWQQILEKNCRESADDMFEEWPLPNVWLGVSVEDQLTADERISILFQTPAAVRFVSYEPALDALFHLYNWLGEWYDDRYTPNHGRGIDWLIIGGESGPKARPCDVAWIRDAVRQCEDSGVACFVKQLGSNARGASLHRYIRDRKGGDPAEWPADLRVREFPEVNEQTKP